MLKRKHTIENLNVNIKNRDRLINDLIIARNNLREDMKKILKLAGSNTYNNDKAILGKIKELAQTAIKY